MPLESCRRCGYALSVLDHHYRHCAPAPPAGPRVHFHTTHLQQIITALAGLALLVHYISIMVDHVIVEHV